MVGILFGGGWIMVDILFEGGWIMADILFGWSKPKKFSTIA